MNAATNNSHGGYGATDITVVAGLEAVRKRPGMYIGSTGERGLHHLIWEVVDNSVDESMTGYATAIGVRLLEDGGVEVSDDGHGIPVEMHASGRPTIDIVLTELHGGLRGVGISVVNALSTRVEVDISRDGYTWFQTYDHTVPGTLKRGDATKKTGTVVRFWADPTIFDTTEYNFETVSDRLQQMAFLNKRLTITLEDERVDTADAQAKAASRRTYHYPDGLVDYIKHLNSAHTPVHTSVICFSSTAQEPEGAVEVEVAMQWNASYSESVHTFANTINTAEGGPHQAGFRSALTTVINKYARDQKLLKAKDANLTGEDIRNGLAAVISVKVGEPQFLRAKARPSWETPAVRSIVQKVCHEQLTRWFDANPTPRRWSRRRCRPNTPGWPRAIVDGIPRKSATALSGLPSKLVDCRRRGLRVMTASDPLRDGDP